MTATYYAISSWLLLLVILHAGLELRQRDRHLKWIELRDVEFVRMFEAAWNLTLIPKGNPLDEYKMNGMLSKRAYDLCSSPSAMMGHDFLSSVDERLGALAGATTAISRSAKALHTWEQSHEAPPLHYWQAWKRAWERRNDPPGRTSERSPNEQGVPTQRLSLKDFHPNSQALPKKELDR